MRVPMQEGSSYAYGYERRESQIKGVWMERALFGQLNTRLLPGQVKHLPYKDSLESAEENSEGGEICTEEPLK